LSNARGQQSKPRRQAPTVGGNAMKNITMRIFLKLKHWQLFLIWIVSVIIFTGTNNSSFWILTTELYGISILGWVYSIGKVINNQIKENKVENHKEDMWFILGLITIIPFGYDYNNFSPNLSMLDLLVFASGILGLVSILKLINFSAKVLNQYENHKEQEFRDYLQEFLLISFMVIGVWTIQPRVNKIISKE
jgi:hypothetical protein